METCQIATLADIDEVRLDERLMERDFGKYSGKSKSIMTNRLQSLNIDIDDPLETVDDVENWNIFSTRLKAVLQDLIKGPREIKTVFTHGGCIKGTK